MFIEHKVNQIIGQLEKYDIGLNIDEIADALEIIVIYNEHLSCYTQLKGHDLIYIKYDTKHEMYKTFTHELGHYFMHSTNQNDMNNLFNEKQEHEADKFSLLFRMPKSLIQDNELYDIKKLMHFFNEDEKSAHKRLNLLMHEMAGGNTW